MTKKLCNYILVALILFVLGFSSACAPSEITYRDLVTENNYSANPTSIHIFFQDRPDKKIDYTVTDSTEIGYIMAVVRGVAWQRISQDVVESSSGGNMRFTVKYANGETVAFKISTMKYDGEYYRTGAANNLLEFAKNVSGWYDEA